jgi:D-arginine dehydrogenase
MKSCRFLIIGAGIAGTSAAYELAAHGDVIVLERETAVGYHSTGRSAAQFIETYGNPAIQRLTKGSRAFFEHPPECFGEHPLLGARGAMLIAREDQQLLLSRTVDDVSMLTPDIQVLSASEAIARVPVLRQDYVATALFEPAAMDIDVHATHHGYLRGAKSRGVEILTGAEVTAVTHENGRWTVETPVGAFAGIVLVNATGAWCDELGRLAGVRPLGLVPKRRTVICFDPPTGLDLLHWPLVIDAAEEFYFKPDVGRILASPADETPVPPCDVQPEELDVAIAVDRIEKATTLRVRRVVQKWAGLRSFVSDKTLVIGMDGEAEGFFWLAGQGGYGIQTAPAAARAAAGLLGDGEFPEDLAELGLTPMQLSPERLQRPNAQDPHERHTRKAGRT